MKVQTQGSMLLGALLFAAAVLGGCAGSSTPGDGVGVTESAVTIATSECCLAQRGTDQSFCDSLPQTADRCNQVNGGTSCTWVCPPPCCQALPGTSQSFCDSLPQTPDRCNQANMGTSCTWTCR
jgi:hypothetical protein